MVRKSLNRKAKGINAERELIHVLWEAGWAAVRVAGSGAISFPSPDVVAGNGIRKVAIEAKVTGSNSKYFSKLEIAGLRKFASAFGAEPWVAVKFPKRDWLFINPEDLKETDKGFSVNVERAVAFGLLFSEFISPS
jgi:Holliday junction resolvase